MSNQTKELLMGVIWCLALLYGVGGALIWLTGSSDGALVAAVIGFLVYCGLAPVSR
jgi:tryptophan-rich sensory protein